MALNNKPGIGDDTRRRIMKVVKETGYIHRSMVRNDRNQETKQIRFLACLKADIISTQYNTSSFFVALIHGLEQRARSAGYALIFSTARRDKLKEDLVRLEDELPSQGVILLGTNLNPPEIEDIIDVQPNTIVLDTCYELLNTNFIVMNNRMGAYSAGSYLLELGHGRIGYVQSQERIHNFEQRRQGFFQALSENGIKVLERDIISIESDIERAQKDFSEIISKRKKEKAPLPTALFCECDYIAIGVIKSLHELGFRVPEDVSVVGFDNVSESTIVSPRLTTIHVEKEKMGSMAVRRIIDIIENRDSVRIKSIIDTKLEERDSCRRI